MAIGIGPHFTDLDPLTLADVNAGDYLEIRGDEFPAGSGTILATIFEREDPDNEAILQGFVESISDPSMVILGAGTLGRAAARYAQGIGAHVVILDRATGAVRRVHDLSQCVRRSARVRAANLDERWRELDERRREMHEGSAVYESPDVLGLLATGGATLWAANGSVPYPVYLDEDPA